MPRKCPPGVFCISNITILTVFLLFMAFYSFKTSVVTNHNVGNHNVDNTRKVTGTEMRINESRYYGDSVLLNPHVAPLRDDRVSLHTSGDIRGIPVNIPTQSVDAAYRQIGILTRMNGPEMILPLMGRPLITNRDKWQFYTMSDHNPHIKLPLSNAGKSCTGEYGCDNLTNGDTVYVEGYNDAFKVTSYENNVMRYIPFI